MPAPALDHGGIHILPDTQTEGNERNSRQQTGSASGADEQVHGSHGRDDPLQTRGTGGYQHDGWTRPGRMLAPRHPAPQSSGTYFEPTFQGHHGAGVNHKLQRGGNDDVPGLPVWFSRRSSSPCGLYTWTAYRAAMTARGASLSVERPWKRNQHVTLAILSTTIAGRKGTASATAAPPANKGNWNYRQSEDKNEPRGGGGQKWCTYSRTHDVGDCRSQGTPHPQEPDSYTATAAPIVTSLPEDIREDAGFDRGFRLTTSTGGQTAPPDASCSTLPWLTRMWRRITGKITWGTPETLHPLGTALLW